MIDGLILHIGDQKTGTTSLQTTLTENRELLAGEGLIYPIDGPRINHRPEAMAFEPGTRFADREGEIWSAMAARLRAAPDGATAILSSERFELLDPANVRAGLERHVPELMDGLRLVGYVRPHLPRIAASYAESVKQGGWEGDVRGFHADIMGRNPGRFSYAIRYGRWREAFGDALEVRVMDRARLRGGDVIVDFLEDALGRAGLAARLTPVEPANETLSAEELAAFRVIHETLRGPKRHHVAISKALGWHMAPIFRANRVEGRKFALDRALAQELAETHRADARAMDAAFFGGVPTLDVLLDEAIAKAPLEPADGPPEETLGAGEVGRLRALATALRRTVSGRAAWLRDDVMANPFGRPRF